MDGATFLDNFTSSTAGIISNTFVPLLMWGIGVILAVWFTTLIVNALRKGTKKAFR